MHSLDNPPGQGMSIQQRQAQLSHEAIVFFRDGAVSKEMLYTEFEALLDCVVPMREFAGNNMEAAYVRLDGSLTLGAAVLFTVAFDASGFPEQSWNIPLRHLAESASRGPDMGSGAIRLATRSQCPIAGHEKNLWDVRYDIAGNTLNQLQEKLRINRLGLDADDVALQSPPAMPPPQQWQMPAPQQNWQIPPSIASARPAESTDAMLAMMQQNSQQFAQMEQNSRRIAQMREDVQRESLAAQQRLAAAQEQLQILTNEKAVLVEQLGMQAQKSHGEREQSDRKIRQLLEHARDEREQLERNLREVTEKLHEERSQVEQKLQQQAEMSRLQLENLRSELERERNAALAKRDEQLRQAMERLEQERLAAAADQQRELREERERLEYERDSAIAERDERHRVEVERLEQERNTGIAERERALAERDEQWRIEQENRDRERRQQEEQQAKLVAEITELRRDKLRLMGEGMDKFFESLNSKGVKFVSFQPGAGHVTIAMDDLHNFVNDTESYVAKKCGVSVEHYGRWLTHYTNPVCQGSSGSGGLCAKPLSKMLKPVEFVGGMHDRCEIHKQVPRSRAAEKTG
jgi:hypothetical protein